MRSPGRPSEEASVRLRTGVAATDARATATVPAVEFEEDTAPQPALDTPKRPPLVVLLGPTASGKTRLALDVAQALNGEIVSADSRQLYRGMDIGTAKPSPRDRALVPHHLIDLVDPDETISLAQYQHAAYAAIHAIHARGRLPLLVGGTGQYITAVVEGWGIPEVPPNPDLRAQLEEYAEQQGARALHQRLQAADPEAAAAIDYRNVRRVVRALEVYYQTGTPISALQRRTPPPFRTLQLGLTLPREALYARIDARIDQMIAAGLLDEVRALLDAGYTWDTPAMSGLGYAQWEPYLSGAATFEEAVAAIRRETRAFARRQYTWFNGHDSGIEWLNAQTVTPQAVIERIRAWLDED